MGSKKFWTEGYGSFAVAILIALSIRWALMEAYVIPSASMLPSLLIHDHIFVNKLVYGVRVPFSEDWLVKFRLPTRGEVIVFKYPLDKSTFFIKRVIGVPGDHVTYDSGKLTINDQLIESSVAATQEDSERSSRQH
jgi:signal peptidase I